MKNFKILGIIAFVAVIGMTVVGCEVEAVDKLNGTWEYVYTELKLNDGSFQFARILLNPGLLSKGTYTTSGSNLTMTVTHIHGDYNTWLPESKWYTRSEAEEAATITIQDWGIYFTTTTEKYSVDGDKLTLGTTTYTRKK